MNNSMLLLLICVITAAAYVSGRTRAQRLRNSGNPEDIPHSLPRYYGYMAAIWAIIPALLVICLWAAFEQKVLTGFVTAGLPTEFHSLKPGQQNLVINDIKNIAAGNISASATDPVRVDAAARYQSTHSISSHIKVICALLAAVAGSLWGLRSVHPGTHARIFVERAIMFFLIACSSLAILTTIGIVLSVLFESLRFFSKIPFTEFAFGLHWSPQTSIRADQVGSSGSFGAVPIFAGTLLISAIAMLVAVPFGLMSAIYLAEYASQSVRSWVKPLLEILAGIPTVVYGFFAALTVAPMLRGIGESIGLSVASESALAAGLVMGIMIIPFVSSLSDDVITAVPQAMRDGSLGLGATKSETIKKVVIPAALPGIVGGVLLAVSRAIGETMIVVMAAGLAANLTINPLEAVTTVTVQIVTLLTGDQAFDSPKTLAAFALGLMLFITTLILNIIALRTVRKYREAYE
ncbi:phosphate ABC transporter permease subunit PstC [Chromatiales bacterium (ex Bugula neritina AB1)]|nr:phosphate ABC transporter permease subunit PstC [Chromatiales bacterium (ex Bugula neritina AB1)]